MRIISSEIQKQISGLREFESIGLMRLIPNVRLPGLKKMLRVNVIQLVITSSISIWPYSISLLWRQGFVIWREHKVKTSAQDVHAS